MGSAAAKKRSAPRAKRPARGKRELGWKVVLADGRSMYGPAGPLRFKIGKTVASPHPGIFLWPSRHFACFFWSVAAKMAPVAMSVVEVEYDPADVVIDGPARVVSAYSFMDGASREIAVARGKVVAVIDPKDAARFAADEKRRIHAEMDVWAVGKSAYELCLLPKLLQLQATGALQPGGLTPLQVERLQYISGELARGEAARQAAA